MNNVGIVKTVEGLWQEGKLDELDQHFVDGYNPESAIPVLPKGLEGAKMAHGMAMGAIKDRNIEILDIFGTDDKVTVRQRMTFTNDGGVPWFGAPANGAKIDVQWISIYQLKDGKIAGHWATIDGFTMLAQLGLWAPPAMG